MGREEGVLPAPLWERKPESCLLKPGIILAGIPGPAEELSHGRGQSGEWTGDPEPVQSEKKSLDNVVVENYDGCSCWAAARRIGVNHMGDDWEHAAGHMRLFRAGSWELETLISRGPVCGQLRGDGLGLLRLRFLLKR